MNVTNEGIPKYAIEWLAARSDYGDTTILFFRRNGAIVEMDFCVVASQTTVYLRG